MKTILLLAAAVLPLILNSCSYLGETEPFYADGHRRNTYYGVKEEIPPLFKNSTDHRTVTRDERVFSTYPDNGRNGVR